MRSIPRFFLFFFQLSRVILKFLTFSLLAALFILRKVAKTPAFIAPPIYPYFFISPILCLFNLRTVSREIFR